MGTRNGFKDYFSDAPGDYSQYRPHYPEKLYSYLASVSPGRGLAWDCATGTGQSAVRLADYFGEVIATDASAAQIQNATSGSGVHYRVASAEASGLDSDSIDLITVAQALHWFDIPAFAEEAQRVLRPGGVLAVWTYNLLEVKPGVDQLVQHLYKPILGDDWPAERAMVEDGYGEIVLPFEELDPPVFKMRAEWSLEQLIGYLRTWSALKRYRKRQGVDPLEAMQPALVGAWGVPSRALGINWPLSLRVWKI